MPTDAEYDNIIHIMEGCAIAQAIGILWGLVMLFAIGSKTAWLYSSVLLLVVPLAGKYTTQRIKTRKAVEAARQALTAFDEESEVGP